MELTIEKLIYGGDGLARLPADEQGRGKAVFLPFVLEGERVEAVLGEQKPGFARGQAARIQHSSPHRVDAGCPYYQACGGCHYQHSSYEHQLEIKASILRENLRRITKLELPCELKVHPSPPWNYRNRTRMRVHTAPKFALGYLKAGSYELLPIEQCPISSPLINRAIDGLWQAGRNRKFDDRLWAIELFADSEDRQLLVEAYCTPETDAAAARQLAESMQQSVPMTSGVVIFAESSRAVERTSESKALACGGAGYLEYKTAAGSYRVSAGSFFQTNRHMTDELVHVVTSGLSGSTAIDLYAGVGLFSVVLSREFERVTAVEASQQSYADLLYNIPANVKAVRAPVLQYLRQTARISRADLIIVDPPRGGLGKNVAESLRTCNASLLVYVSCDPATLARDLVPLLAGGFHVEQAHMVDLFPQTFHLESVLHLVR